MHGLDSSKGGLSPLGPPVNETLKVMHKDACLSVSAHNTGVYPG